MLEQPQFADFGAAQGDKMRITARWLDPSHGGLNLGFPQND